MKRRSLLFSMLSIMFVLVGLSACGTRAGQSGSLELAPLTALPETMQHASVAVRSAYQFAMSYPEALENVECYCGCGAIGHTSNLACYVSSFDASGNPIFDDHAMGCSICVDIAQDVKRMTAEGLEPSVIRSDIIATYSKFGPPTP